MATAPNGPLGHCLPCPEKEVEPLGASAVKWPGTHQPLEVFCLKLFHSFTVLRERALKLNKQAQTCKYLSFCV